MSRKIGSSLRAVLDNQAGQTLVWWALLIPLMLGVGGIVVDVGYAYICYRQLQTSTDAAALAAASGLPSATTAVTYGTNFSAAPGNSNAYPTLNQPTALTNVNVTVTPGCVTITGMLACSAAVTANAVRVTQTTTIPTFFIRALSLVGINSAQSIPLSATSYAIMSGTQRGPYHVAIVLDTTASMAQSDGGTNCSGTKIQCAERGAQIMLGELDPCQPATTCGTATNGNVSNAVDEVALFTFPAQTAGTQVTNDEACSSKTPSVITYPDSTSLGTLTSYPTVGSTAYNTLVNDYQVVPLVSNYRTSNSTTGSNPLTITSSGVSSTNPSIVNAVGGNSYYGGNSCTGMQAKGGESTFFAGALYTAWQYLNATAASNAQNIIVLLSDGDANGGKMAASSSNLNSNGTYPSSNDQCQQAVNVASAALQNGIYRIYTVGYGVTSGGCETDSSINSPGRVTGKTNMACITLRDIADSDAHFFVDTSSISCPGAEAIGGLDAIFTQIVSDLSRPRLVPNTVSFTASS